MRIFFLFLFLFFITSCNNIPKGYDLPAQCGNSCEVAGTMNELKDAVENSAASFSNCICLKSGVVSGDLNVGKSLNIIGKKDGTSRFEGVERGLFVSADGTLLKDINIISGKQGITVSKAKNVSLENIVISGISSEYSVISIDSSDVSMKNVKISNISAGSLYGGRGIVVTGENSNILIESSTVDNVDATGLIVNGVHNVEIDGSSFSNCGFAGLWIQNMTEGSEAGQLNITNSKLEDNGAVSLEILGDNKVGVSETLIKGVEKREVSMEVVGDGIVMKSKDLSEMKSSLSLNNIEISGFERAAVIIDGVNGEKIESVNISDLKILDKSGIYGLVVQNAIEPETLRSGIIENPFTENDKNLEEPLYLIESIEMQ